MAENTNPQRVIKSIENLRLTAENIIEFGVILDDEERVTGTVTL